MSSTLYPLQFEPIGKHRLWGGSKLMTHFNKPFNLEQAGESWELSAVSGDVSIVEFGALKGQNLNQLIETYAEQLLGKHVYQRFGNEFPVLIKFIDAQKDLSIQLHPSDAIAKERHNSFGKNEMWYIMDADPGAQLIVGFKEDIKKETYASHLRDDRLEELLHYETVSKGDTFFIKTGKVHAIGAGVVLAEIQQTSDVTYRIFDWNRKDVNGNLRELHTDLALDAIDYSKKDDFKIKYDQGVNTQNSMVDSPYFTTDFLNVKGHQEIDLKPLDSFVVLMCVEGKSTIHSNDQSYELSSGNTFLIPAALDIILIKSDSAKILMVYIN